MVTAEQWQLNHPAMFYIEYAICVGKLRPILQRHLKYDLSPNYNLQIQNDIRRIKNRSFYGCYVFNGYKFEFGKCVNTHCSYGIKFAVSLRQYWFIRVNNIIDELTEPNFPLHSR